MNFMPFGSENYLAQSEEIAKLVESASKQTV